MKARFYGAWRSTNFISPAEDGVAARRRRRRRVAVKATMELFILAGEAVRGLMWTVLVCVSDFCTNTMVI